VEVGHHVVGPQRRRPKLEIVSHRLRRDQAGLAKLAPGGFLEQADFDDGLDAQDERDDD
jgi:hypothetical protein